MQGLVQAAEDDGGIAVDDGEVGLDRGVRERAALLPLLQGAEVEVKPCGELRLREAELAAERSGGRGGNADHAGGKGEFTASVTGGFAGGGDEAAGEWRAALALS